MRNGKSERKTANVAQMLLWANNFLTNSKPEQVGERRGTHSLMETVLHETGNYVGFGYTGMVPKANMQGYDIPDESRTFFYVSRALKADYQYFEQKQREENR